VPLAPLANHLSARLLLAIGPLVKIGNLRGAANFSGYVTPASPRKSWSTTGTFITCVIGHGNGWATCFISCTAPRTHDALQTTLHDNALTALAVPVLCDILVSTVRVATADTADTAVPAPPLRQLQGVYGTETTVPVLCDILVHTVQVVTADTANTNVPTPPLRARQGVYGTEPAVPVLCDILVHTVQVATADTYGQRSVYNTEPAFPPPLLVVYPWLPSLVGFLRFL
jgi:hypothetical protein